MQEKKNTYSVLQYYTLPCEKDPTKDADFSQRRSENDSTLGRPKLENANISISFMVNYIMPPNSRP